MVPVLHFHCRLCYFNQISGMKRFEPTNPFLYVCMRQKRGGADVSDTLAFDSGAWQLAVTDTQRWKPEHSGVDSHSTRLSGTFYTKCSVNQSVSVSEPEHSVFVYVCANFGFSSSLHTILSADSQPLTHIVNSLSACHCHFANLPLYSW